MKCPHCLHDFPLTWDRYLKSPLGRHICPSCRKVSKLALSRFPLLKSIAPVLIVAAVSTKVVTSFFVNNIMAALFTILICLLMGIPWDKYCDSTRQLSPLKK